MTEKLLCAMIKQWRTAMSKKKNVNSWSILTNETCHQIARAAPQTKDALKVVKGIGKVKLAKYGDDLIQIVQSVLKRGNTPARSAEMDSAKRNAKRQKIEHASPRLAAAAAASMAVAASPATVVAGGVTNLGSVENVTVVDDSFSDFFSDSDGEDFQS